MSDQEDPAIVYAKALEADKEDANVMTIDREGTITIAPDGLLLVQGFHVTNGTTADLARLAEDRVLKCAARIRADRQLEGEMDGEKV